MNFPKTPGQCKYMLALRSQKPIIIGTGPAGSGKTMLACQIAIENIHKYSRSRVILTRPIVAADEDMGYLPGDLFQKMEPWTKPMYDIFEKHLTHNQMDRSIVIEPLGYMRGRTFDDTIIIADEMQNSTPNQMKMLLTRVGEGTRLIVTENVAVSLPSVLKIAYGKDASTKAFIELENMEWKGHQHEPRPRTHQP